MAKLLGRLGAVLVDGSPVQQMRDWSVEVDVTYYDLTPLGSTTRVNVPVVRGWAGSASGLYDPADTVGQAVLERDAWDSVAAQLRLYVDPVNCFWGDAYVSESVSAPHDGVVAVAYTFTGTDTLHWSGDGYAFDAAAFYALTFSAA